MSEQFPPLDAPFGVIPTLEAPALIIGLMSGTSMDGVDAALLWTDGRHMAEPRGFVFRPYPPEFRSALAHALTEPSVFAFALKAALTDHHIAAIQALLDETGTAADAVRLIGFHGHTVLHKPAAGRTWQLGDAGRLAKAFGIPVVADLRAADVAAGGEGAPLAPVYHQALASALPKPAAFLNLGGVANVTWIGPGPDDLVAFDTGPANMLLDEWALRKTGQPIDKGGQLSASGRVDPATLATLLSAPYFARPAPKSLDRLDFDLGPVSHLSAGDGAATLLAFTVESVAASLAHLPAPPLAWYVCGGGRHNPVLMQALATRLGVPVLPVEHLARNGDALEAEAFAYLAARSLQSLPISFPGTTAAPEPLTGGVLTHPAPPPSPLTIRPAEPRDAASLATLIAEFKRTAGDTPFRPLSAAEVLADGFGDTPAFAALIAHLEGEPDPVGYALFYPNYASEYGIGGLFLHDLYVQPDHRSQGIGQALIEATAAHALATGRAFLQWRTRAGNTNAKRLYRRIGAIEDAQFVYVLIAESLDRLADSAARRGG